MLEKIFELADKCNKKDTDINKIPVVYDEGRVSYFISMTHPFDCESNNAQDTLLDFLANNCLASNHVAFMHDVYRFIGFEVEVVFFDWGFGFDDDEYCEDED